MGTVVEAIRMNIFNTAHQQFLTGISDGYLKVQYLKDHKRTRLPDTLYFWFLLNVLAISTVMITIGIMNCGTDLYKLGLSFSMINSQNFIYNLFELVILAILGALIIINMPKELAENFIVMVTKK